MSIEVLRPGLATTVQDAGRPGYYNVGIPLSGAMDQYSLRVANLLVGNDETAAALECALMGPELRFHTDAVIAVAGSTMTPKFDGVAQACNTALAVRAGTVVSFDFMRAGARAYVAIAGGIDVPVVLGSRSTYGLGAFGGFQGRKLAVGDRLPVGVPQRTPTPGRSVDASLVMPLDKEVPLRVVPGLYFHRITDASAQTFFDDTWVIAPEADRIGVRCRSGRPLEWRPRAQPFGAGSDPSNIVDAGYPYGSIQVPGGVEPIILHRDAVSGGGYAMIGTVISADMDRIAQMQPNYKARFVRVDMAQALAARAERRAKLDRLRAALA
ncbi:MAG: biotin-dependent carboxyltransferase family protein [Burkholderiales bacterium]|jgi:biotin-dependent carboxylase-like uncharacterized protein|nr:biotin-dependent carboxyltransferase family protein [Burkholderiales bacterium]